MTAHLSSAFFGRRKGHALRDHQQSLMQNLLPELQISLDGNFAEMFPHSPENIWLEIGFGGGEHLVHQAMQHPEIGFIGCEPFINGVAKLLAAIDEHKLTNIRIWHEDAIQLMDAMPSQFCERIYLLYPDPWPKWRQRKRRFVSQNHLEKLSRVLKTDGKFCFASDIDDYNAWTLSHIQKRPDFIWIAERANDWRKPWNGWPSTRYEAKAFREGRKPSYLTFQKI